ncbi:hypothetical protein K488DRAFT_87143 [Vararia minispora EC-137]|uniref:Uncharacterized protein n=1 Tax=Vararia minispora EC-137 TaxID=1314806 RepID=A0ACB8QHN4_9AGAM|nr:hypothetical protein K488DRAFT_87143 [Vararia minispora EC-137]
MSLDEFLSREPDSIAHLQEVLLDIDQVQYASIIRTLVADAAIRVMSTNRLVTLEITGASSWSGILPGSIPFPHSLKHLYLRNTDVSFFRTIVESAKDTSITTLHAYFLDRHVHSGVADCLWPLHQSTNLKELRLEGHFDGFHPSSSSILPAVSTLFFGFTRRPSTGELVHMFPALKHLHFIPRLWYQPESEVRFEEYKEINRLDQRRSIWPRLETLSGLHLSLSITSVFSPISHLILEVIDLPSVSVAWSIMNKYRPFKVTFVACPRFLHNLVYQDDLVHETFDTANLDFLRGMAFALDDPYILFLDRELTQRTVLVVRLAKVPYFEIAYTRSKRLRGVAPPDNASDRALAEVAQQLAALCPSVQLLGLDTLNRGMTFWQVINRDYDYATVALMRPLDGESFRNSLIGTA